MQQSEIWAPIKGYEGLYEISSFGLVRSLDKLVNTGILHSTKRFIPGKVLLGTCSKNNWYPFVTLRTAISKKNFTIHKLVAEAFIPNPLRKP